MSHRFNNPRLLAALEKASHIQRVGMDRMQQSQAERGENALMSRLITALESMGNLTSFVGPKGDRGLMGPRGLKGDKGDRGEKGEKGDMPIAGRDYPIPKDGKDGRDGEDGRDGKDADISRAEMVEVAEKAAHKHVKEVNHALIHDSKMIGEYELDVANIKDGDILQVKGKKIIGMKMPKHSRGQEYYSQPSGASNVRSITVTTSRELDVMGIYVIDASAGDITITVPTAAGRENFWFELIRIDSSENTVTVLPTGAETMSGMTDYIMQQWTNLKLFAYQSNYLLRSAS